LHYQSCTDAGVDPRRRKGHSRMGKAVITPSANPERRA
jgi:hypothetical protein